MAQKASKFFNPKYKEEIPKCKEFLMIFEDSSIEADPLHGQKKYMIQMVFLIFHFIYDNFLFVAKNSQW